MKTIEQSSIIDFIVPFLAGAFLWLPVGILLVILFK